MVVLISAFAGAVALVIKKSLFGDSSRGLWKILAEMVVSMIFGIFGAMLWNYVGFPRELMGAGAALSAFMWHRIAVFLDRATPDQILDLMARRANKPPRKGGKE